MIEGLLTRWIMADSKISRLKQTMNELERDLKEAQMEAADAANSIKAEMQSTGEYEINVAGEYCDYKIHFTTPRESVKVENVDAVPDEFVKVERKPKLKEIGEYIRQCDEKPNWVTIQLGESNLTYKICKRA